MRQLLLFLSLLVTVATQAQNLSTVVMEEKLSENPNYVFSNTSIDGLLTLVGYGYDASRVATLEQYWNSVSLDQKSQKILGLNRDEEGLIVSVNNQVWLNDQFQFLPQYVSALDFNFGISPQLMDVSQPTLVADEVNQWASNNTNELIKKVLRPDQVSGDTVSILANAVYFKGEWEESFDAEQTVEAPFYGVGDVSMMTKQSSGGLYVPLMAYMNPTDGVLIVELPFKGETHSLVIAMPAKMMENNSSYDYVYDSTAMDVNSVFANYIANGRAFDDLYNYGMTQDYEKFQMPKFEIETEINNIEKKLADLGLATLFDKGALSNMVDDPRAELSKVFQKAKIIINEKGGEAAAVSVGIVTTESFVMPQGELLVNGPFAFAIRDKQSEETLFEGVVTEP